MRLATVVGPDLAVGSLVGYGRRAFAEIAALAEREMRFINAEDQTDEPIRFTDY